LGDQDAVCLMDGKPTIQVRANKTYDNWLYDTGASITVISDELYQRMDPAPKLKANNLKVTGANKKPLAIRGTVKLTVTILNEVAEISALVCDKLSYTGILGMDTIKKLNLVLNPKTFKFYKIKDTEVHAVTTQTYRLPPMSARPVKIKAVQESQMAPWLCRHTTTYPLRNCLYLKP